MTERGKGIWVTKDGRLIKISDMDDDHLVNSISLLKRAVGKMRFDCGFSACSLLGLCNGEMALGALESELSIDAQMSNEEWLERNTSYGELIEEVIRRNIAYMIGAPSFSYMDRYAEVIQ